MRASSIISQSLIKNPDSLLGMYRPTQPSRERMLTCVPVTPRSHSSLLVGEEGGLVEGKWTPSVLRRTGAEPGASRFYHVDVCAPLTILEILWSLLITSPGI